jgi:hypothetical protein
LHRAAASIVEGIFVVTVSTADKDRDFRRPRPGSRQVDAFWQMSRFSSSVGAMLIARVGDPAKAADRNGTSKI